MEQGEKSQGKSILTEWNICATMIATDLTGLVLACSTG